MLSKPLALAMLATLAIPAAVVAEYQMGPRPAFLISQMAPSELKDRLMSCTHKPVKRTLFSIAHRGAPMMFPEHTAESYRAAAQMGAGIVECDVTFTRDKELVCRHAQNDLHTTTNILSTDLASTCKQAFVPANGEEKAKAECRASEITLAEFKTLKGKMDAADRSATDITDYQNGTANWRTDLYARSAGTLMTHAESIELIKSLGGKFTPELKTPSVEMPFDGFSQADYAQKMIDEYKAANVDPSDVWVQSFNLDDVLYWIENEPEFGRQAVYLDASYKREDFDHNKPETFKPGMRELADKGVRYIAPPMWMLVTLDGDRIVPSAYAREAKAADLKLITWTLERSGPLNSGGGWYYQSIKETIKSDGQMYELLHVLAKDVGIAGIFSDWPATVSYYASCFDLD